MTDLSKEGDTLGFPALVPQNNKLNFLHNQRLGKVEYLSNKIGGKFLYHCLCDREYRFVIVGSASGTTVKHTSPSKILLHNILFSGGELEASFEKIIITNFEKVERNNLETETLIQLRDRLLPELISGKVRVKEGECLNV
jgi:type I restriction enzyme S subunit